MVRVLSRSFWSALLRMALLRLHRRTLQLAVCHCAIGICAADALLACISRTRRFHGPGLFRRHGSQGGTTIILNQFLLFYFTNFLQ